MRIGIFGGSFDPVHVEHTNLCEGAIKSLRLDKLFVVPARIPPHKQGKALSESEHRLAMCKIAFSKMEKVEVSDYELTRVGTSFTYLTIQHFHTLYPTAELYFLVGTDMLRDFPTWKNPDIILSLATLAVCARAEEADWEEKERKIYFEKVRTQKDFAVIGYEGEEVSSTRARVMFFAGEEPTDWIDPAVLSYIKEHDVYHMPYVKEALAKEKPSRKEHTLRVAFFVAEHAKECGVDETLAVKAALLHDCAKNLQPNDPLLEGFVCPQGVPKQVWHQFAGAYLCEKRFGVKEEEVLSAVRYHTSGRVGMSDLEKLIFLADMLEEGRDYPEVYPLRKRFEEGLNECLEEALYRTLVFLEEKGEPIYSLTQEAYEWIKRENEKEKVL